MEMSEAALGGDAQRAELFEAGPRREASPGTVELRSGDGKRGGGASKRSKFTCGSLDKDSVIPARCCVQGPPLHLTCRRDSWPR